MIRRYEDGLEIDLYTLADNDEALALDREAAQGGAFRLSFHRSTFHRRAENFTEHLLFTGRIDGRLVALAALHSIYASTPNSRDVGSGGGSRGTPETTHDPWRRSVIPGSSMTTVLRRPC
jgi:hypothetical protein